MPKSLTLSDLQINVSYITKWFIRDKMKLFKNPNIKTVLDLPRPLLKEEPKWLQTEELLQRQPGVQFFFQIRLAVDSRKEGGKKKWRQTNCPRVISNVVVILRDKNTPENKD